MEDGRSLGCLFSQIDFSRSTPHSLQCGKVFWAKTGEFAIIKQFI